MADVVMPATIATDDHEHAVAAAAAASKGVRDSQDSSSSTIQLPTDNKEREAAEPVDPLHVLMRVVVVCRERPQVAALLHVALSIDAFLYRPQYYRMTLKDAVADDNVHLLRRLLSDMARGRGTHGVHHPFFVGRQISKAARLAVERLAAKQSSLSPRSKLLLQCLLAADPEAVGASEVVEEAAAAGDLGLTKWLHAICPFDPEVTNASRAAARAGGGGHVHVLEWLFANRWTPQSRFPVAEVVSNRQHQVLQWLDENRESALLLSPVRVCIERGVIRDAAGQGDLDMLAWLFHHRQEDDALAGAGDGAAAHGHVSVLEWLVAHHPDEAACQRDGYVKAARNGHIEVLRWLYAHHPKRFWAESMEAAASAGHMEIVKFLHEQREEGDAVGVRAANGGHFEIVKFLYDFYPMANNQVLQRAAAVGSLELIKWLHETQGQSLAHANALSLAIRSNHVPVVDHLFSHLSQALPDRTLAWTIHVAVEANNMEMMERLHARVLELSRTVANPPQGLDRWMRSADRHSLPVDAAARSGNLEMIKWLIANGYEECTHLAMDKAAECGHLDVVQWLHESRAEGCTTDAMDKAAGNGKLDVVMWLHENRAEGCTTDAVDLAVRDGHPRVVEFLLANRSEGCTSAVARVAIEDRRDAELIHLLYAYRPALIAVKRVRAHAVGNEGMQHWLRQVGGERQELAG